MMLAWMVTVVSERIGGRALKGAYAAICVCDGHRELRLHPAPKTRECGGDSFRPAANEIAKVVAAGEPLYLYGFDEEVAPLLFYLDRDAPDGMENSATHRPATSSCPPAYGPKNVLRRSISNRCWNRIMAIGI